MPRSVSHVFVTLVTLVTFVGLLALGGCAADPRAAADPGPLPADPGPFQQVTATVFTDGGCEACRDGHVPPELWLRVLLEAEGEGAFELTATAVTLRAEDGSIGPIALPPGAPRTRSLAAGEPLTVTWSYGYPDEIERAQFERAWVIEVEIEAVDVETGERATIRATSATFSFEQIVTG